MNLRVDSTYGKLTIHTKYGDVEGWYIWPTILTSKQAIDGDFLSYPCSSEEDAKASAERWQWIAKFELDVW